MKRNNILITVVLEDISAIWTINEYDEKLDRPV